MNVTLTNNLIVAPADYDDLFIGANEGQEPADFLPVPGSPVDFGNGLGAEDLLATIAKPLVYITVSRGVGVDAQDVTFVAEPYPGGGFVEAGASYAWVFGDGVGTDTGKEPGEYAYQTTGDMVVEVTVTPDGGSPEVVDKKITVKSPLLVDADFDNALDNQGGSGGTFAWVGSSAYVDLGGGDYAADFDGTGDNYVALSGAGSELTGMDQVTLSFDFHVDAATGFGRAVCLFTAYGTDFTDSDTIGFYLATDSNYARILNITASGAFDGNWHHLMASYDALTGTATLYLDGTSIGTNSSLSGPIPVVTGRDLIIGTDGFGNNFDGQIDNLHIYNGIVTPATEATILPALRGRM